MKPLSAQQIRQRSLDRARLIREHGELVKQAEEKRKAIESVEQELGIYTPKR